jgi:hypothetical protein
MKTSITLLLLTTFVSTSQACDDFANEMSNQTVIMQQQLNQQHEAAWEKTSKPTSEFQCTKTSSAGTV